MTAYENLAQVLAQSSSEFREGWPHSRKSGLPGSPRPRGSPAAMTDVGL
jgi:hypothetical protein